MVVLTVGAMTARKILVVNSCKDGGHLARCAKNVQLIRSRRTIETHQQCQLLYRMIVLAWPTTAAR
jgi:hypothetical protein